MRLDRQQAYRIVRFVLENREFKQLEIHKRTGISFSWVNAVVNWLVARGFAAKRTGGYKLIAPAALAQALSFFRRMEELRFASFEVDADEQELKKLFSQHGAVLCLTSALARYDDYFRDPSVHAYANEGIADALREFPSGRVSVSLYRDDLLEKEDFEMHKGLKVTGKIRTVIDVLCSQRAYAVDSLIRKMWG